jgi:hypothetical protein
LQPVLPVKAGINAASMGGQSFGVGQQPNVVGNLLQIGFGEANHAAGTEEVRRGEACRKPSRGGCGQYMGRAGSVVTRCDRAVRSEEDGTGMPNT